jgi:hypothetical protein
MERHCNNRKFVAKNKQKTVEFTLSIEIKEVGESVSIKRTNAN